MYTVHASMLDPSGKIHTVWNRNITRILINRQFYVKFWLHFNDGKINTSVVQ
jgi:hypothetical protein